MTTAFKQRSLGGKAARASALCLLALAATLLHAREARAQWTSPDAAGNISTTNTGNVGVGTAAPASRLEVRGATADANASALNVTDSTGRGILFVKNNGQVGVGGAYAWNTLSVFTPTGTRGGLSIVGDGTEWNYADLFIGPASNTSIATGKPISFGFSVMKNNPSYGGDATGPSFALVAPRQGGGTYVPLIVNPNGNLILAGASNATNGNVGIGTASPTQALHVKGKGLVQNTGTASAFIMDRTDGKIASMGAGGDSATFAYDNTGVFKIESNTRANINTGAFGGGATTRLLIDGAGNVGIGATTLDAANKLTVEGNVHVTGNISAKYQDVAEWVPSTQPLAAGTVVALDTTRANHVVASASAYDTRVAGVVSAQPGLILGEGGEGKVMVATTGRVKVKVDATRAPIQIGDLIVTSGAAGVAMRSEAVSFGGVSMHRPGTIIGKALESLEKGTGEILVLLSLQ